MNILGSVLNGEEVMESADEDRESRLSELFSLEENRVKLSDFLAIKNNVLTVGEIAEFRRFAEQLIDQPKPKKSDREWLEDYIKNLYRLDRAIAENAAGHMTPPLPPRPDSRDHAVYEQLTINSRKQPTIKLNELVIKPTTFDGVKPEPRKWLDDYENAAEANGWSDALKARYMQTFLSETARDWLVTLARRKLGVAPAWRDLRSSFIRHYLGDTDKNKLRRQIATTFQRHDEKAAEFIPRLLRLLTLLEPSRNEEDLVEEIRAKLRGFYQDKLALLDIQSLDKLNDACLRVEAGAAAAKSTLNREFNYDRRQGWQRQASNSRGNHSRRDTRLDKKQNNVTPPRSHARREDNKFNSQTPHLASVKCYRCDRVGHYASKCKANKKEDGSSINNRQTKAKEIAIVNSGMEVTSCDTGAQINTIRQAGRNIIAMAADNNDLLKHPVKCNDVPVEAVIDTGAIVSVVDPSLVMANNWPLIESNQTLNHAAGGALQVVGEVKVELEINGVRRPGTKLVVVDNLCTPLIIGLDVLSQYKAVLNIGTNQLELAKGNEAKHRRGVVVDGATLPPRSMNVISAKINLDEGEVLCTPFNFDPNIMVAYSVGRPVDHKIRVLVTNINKEAICLAKGQQIASIVELESQENENPIGLVTTPSIQISGCDEIVPIGNLNEQQVIELGKLINRYKQAFSTNGAIGRTSLVDHKIELIPNAKPIVEPMRRHPRHHELEAEKQVAKMLAEGIVERSESPWASEYVLVKKKDGQMRLCVDFRKLNNITKKNSFPLPNAEECIETLAGKKIYSKLDFASGYWQVPMDNESKEYTAFRTNKGLYQFRVMPFGLCNAPASFQRMMNALVAGLRGLDLQVYLDDICLASNTWQEHLELLEKVFVLIIRANLRLKSSKCLLGAASVSFLGHIIGPEGVRQDPEKLKALAELPRPEDVSGVRRVLGAFSYYRKFIPRFADISEPLTRLTRKNAKFEWSQDQQESFDRIKKALLKNGTLTFIDEKGALRLKTDASRIGIGGILLQQKEQEWRIVCCTSRRLNTHEQHYAATELEGLAIVYSISKFRHYLLGRHFEIWTDHCALCALKLKNSENQRLRRWALLLSEFDFDIKYIRGDKHEDADCISRAPVQEPIDEYSSSMLALMYPVDRANWLDDDEETSRYVELARTNQTGWRMMEGVPYFGDKLFVPKRKRAQIIGETHDLAGHDGITGTMNKLKSLFWPAQNEQVANYIRSCLVCQQRKVERSPPMANFYSFKAAHPLEIISVDYMGPISETPEGYKFVCLAIDIFSRFIMAEGVINQAAAPFCAFLTKFVSLFGAPSVMISDNGKQFVNDDVRKICAELHIEHKKLAPYHHRGNAIAERAIQSLQEKMQLISKTQNVNWMMALPKAVQVINQSKRASTKYSPYEIIFSRTAKPSFTSLKEEIKELPSEIVRANVKENVDKASQQSERYFKQKVRQPTFQLGDLVWTKLKERRLAKLADRFEGPYQIIEMENDIYKLENQSKNKRIMRHSSYLKPYHSLAVSMLATLSLLTMIGNITMQIMLQQTGPIYWTEIKDKYVSDGSEFLPYEVYFTSPCPLLLKYDYLLRSQPKVSQNKPMQQAASVPMVVIQNTPPPPKIQMPASLQIQAQMPLPPLAQTAQSPTQLVKTSNFNQPFPRMPTFVPSLPQRDGGIPKHVLDTVNEHLQELDEMEEEVEIPEKKSSNDGLWLSKDELAKYKNQTRLKRTNTNNPLYDRCEDVYSSTILTQLNQFNQQAIREKRFVSFVLGFLLSNVIDTVKDRYFSDKTDATFEDRWAHAQTQLRILNDKTDLIALAQKAQLKIQKQTINEINSINTRMGILPTINIIADYLIIEMQNKRQLLNRLYYSLAEEHADLVTLAQLFGTIHFDKLLAQDVNVVSVKSPSTGVLKIAINGKVRSNDTKVFHVHAFSHYQNLTDTPIRLDYTGKTILIKNYTNNCVKSINTDNNEFIATMCLDENYRDPALQLWRRTVITDINNEPRHSSYALLWPNSIVYCWGHNITIKTTTTRCPHYTFLVNTTASFRTSDNLVVHKGKDTQKIKGLEAELDIFDVHFETFDAIHTDYHKGLTRILQLEQLSKDLNAKSLLIKWKDNEIHASHVVQVLTWLTPILIVIYIMKVIYTNHVTKLLKRFQKRDKRSEVTQQVDQRINAIISQFQERNQRRQSRTYLPPIRMTALSRGTYA